MNAKAKTPSVKLTPALGTSVADMETQVRTADIDQAMTDPSVARLDAASRPNVMKPEPKLRPEPEPETLENKPEPFPVPRPSYAPRLG